MSIQISTWILVGVTFSLYIGIAIWSRAGSTKEFYVAGGGVSPLANGLATAADWMSAASFISMAGIISFTMDLAHPHDIGTILDQDGIAIRTGHHCAQPVMDFFDVPSTARMSLGLYNTTEDIDRLIEGLHKVNRIFS